MPGMNIIGKPVLDVAAKYANDPQFREGVNQGVNTVVNTAQRMRGRGNGDGSNLGGSRGSRHSSGYALTSQKPPQIISLDTGVAPNTYTDDIMSAVENKCVPLHMTCAIFQFPNYAASYLYNYFLQISAFDMQTKAQANVGFNVDLTTFSQANILTAMNSLASALQVYFYYRSIISYRFDPNNKNEGMLNLRSNITPTILESLDQLGHRLMDTPCPPNLYNFIRYLMGNFQTGTIAGSSLIKICPFAPSDTCISASELTTQIAALTASNSVYTLMRRAIPQWRPVVLNDYEPTPIYDGNFKTIFANLGFVWYNGASSGQAPFVAAESDTISYNSFTDSLDGVAYSLTSVWSTTVSARLPSLMQPQIGANFNGENRVSFYQVASISKFYSATAYPYVARSRPETYITNDVRNNFTGYHLDSAVKCQSVSALTIRDTAMKAMDYLLSADTIINPDVKATLTGKPSGSSRSKTKYGSSKKKKS